jgi:murein DD-endopeptidase MepM/ murein hydrolase activator NlpD
MFLTPLNKMKLRTKELESAYGASYGEVRNWNPAAHNFTRFHQGWDLEAPVGTPCYAICDGVITHRCYRNPWGANIVLQFSKSGQTGVSPVDPLWAFYAHLSAILVVEDQLVTAGQIIGFTGHTGSASASAPHLHFEIRNTSNPSPGLGPIGRLDPASILGYRYLICS